MQVATASDLSPDFLRHLCELLGLPQQGLIELRIKVSAAEPILVEAAYYVMQRGKPVIDAAQQSFMTEMSRFELVKLDLD